MDMVKNTLNRITSMIKRAVLTLPASDAGVNQIAQASYLGKTANVELLSIYGLCSNPPTGSSILLFDVQGQEENRAGIANFPGSRFKTLKPGEVALGNYITKSNIRFLENGDIQVIGTNNMTVTIAQNNTVTIGGSATINVTGSATINCASATLTAATTTINSNVTINGSLNINGNSTSNGNFTTSGDVVASGISLSTHVHGGVQNGGGVTNPPS
jgi:phage gp45-like